MALCLATPAWAGPPFLTDDPVPTDTGHWEIYAPAFDAAGSDGEWEGAAGAEVNYGAAEDVQITVGVPLTLAHTDGHTSSGFGDLEASVKYRFYHDESAGVSLAVFPGLTLPTAHRGYGAGRVTALLPVWAEKDSGPWSIFGGGGYAINPGPGNRDYWTGGIAVTRALGESFALGIEATRDGPDTIEARASTSLGVGAIASLGGPFRLLASGGPTYGDDGSHGWHAFAALGIDL